MLIRHLALTVRDPGRSADFYLSAVGLYGRAKVEAWGIRLDLDDGFLLALIRGERSPGSARDAVHFGCTLPGPGQAREIRERMHTLGVREIEWEDSDGYVGVKVADPDGYVVELFYEFI